MSVNQWILDILPYIYIRTLETSQKAIFYTGKKGILTGLVSTARVVKM